ncbi:hypothetical protein ARMGADRAFT_1017377, partial [Armillaria gallica]
SSFCAMQAASNRPYKLFILTETLPDILYQHRLESRHSNAWSYRLKLLSPLPNIALR